jgi:hypothetical protein
MLSFHIFFTTGKLLKYILITIFVSIDFVLESLFLALRTFGLVPKRQSCILATLLRIYLYNRKAQAPAEWTKG